MPKHKIRTLGLNFAVAMASLLVVTALPVSKAFAQAEVVDEEAPGARPPELRSDRENKEIEGEKEASRPGGAPTIHDNAAKAAKKAHFTAADFEKSAAKPAGDKTAKVITIDSRKSEAKAVAAIPGVPAEVVADAKISPELKTADFNWNPKDPNAKDELVRALEKDSAPTAEGHERKAKLLEFAVVMRGHTGLKGKPLQNFMNTAAVMSAELPLTVIEDIDNKEEQAIGEQQTVYADSLAGLHQDEMLLKAVQAAEQDSTITRWKGKGGAKEKGTRLFLKDAGLNERDIDDTEPIFDEICNGAAA